MALQSDELTALGLGITADQPLIALQPALGDGIHLRYATSFAKGLPWGGFFLFRRRHIATIPQCLSLQLAGLKPQLTSAATYAFDGVSLYSGTQIEFIDEFAATGTAEVTLPATALLGAGFEQGPVHRVTAKIGFRGSDPLSGRVCGTAQFLFARDDNPGNPLVNRASPSTILAMWAPRRRHRCDMAASAI